jgi:hypothetical protein
VETAKATESCRIEVRLRPPVHLLALYEEGLRREGMTCIEGPPSRPHNLKGKLLFVPSGREYYDWQEPSRLSRVAYFYLDPAALASDSEALHADGWAPRLFFEDAGLWDIAIRLKALLDGAGSVDQLYCKSLGVVFAHELLRLGPGGARVEPALRGGLAGWQQRVVANYSEEQPGFQTDVWYIAPSIPHAASYRTGQIAAAESPDLSHLGRNGSGVLRNKLILDGLSQGHGLDPDRLSASLLTLRPTPIALRRAQPASLG